MECASRSFHSDADSVCSEDNNDVELTFQHSSSDMGNTAGTGAGLGIGGLRGSDITPPNGFSDNSSSSSNSNSKYDATAFSNLKITGTSTSIGSSSSMNMNGNNYGVSSSNTINNINNTIIDSSSSSSSSSRGEGRTVAWFWALNPLAINICTRGSADSITNCMVLALLYLLMQQSKHTTIHYSCLISSPILLSPPVYHIISYISSLLLSSPDMSLHLSSHFYNRLRHLSNRNIFNVVNSYPAITQIHI